MMFSFCLNLKEAAIEEMKKELQERPTSKLVDDLRKKVKILQVTQIALDIYWVLYYLYIVSFFHYEFYIGSSREGKEQQWKKTLFVIVA